MPPLRSSSEPRSTSAAGGRKASGPLARARHIEGGALLTGAAYAAILATLLLTRLVGLDRDLASDEIKTVRDYVSLGPRAILFGDYLPNNHQLFSVLAWVTRTTVSEAEVVIRLWSVIPFVAGAVLGAAWLHRGGGGLAGVIYLLLATASPLLLDLTRQARGYGIAFLAMTALLISALEALRTARLRHVLSFCAAGIAGTWTLPHFAIAFGVTALPLLFEPRLRRATIAGLGTSSLATLIWYGPHLRGILESSRQDYAAPIETAWLLTAPFDQILSPALTRIDPLVQPSLGTLVLAVLCALAISRSPFLERREAALVLCGAPVATILAFWLTQTNVVPRFLSYLTVPLFMLLATGAARALRCFLQRGRPLLSNLAAVALLALVGVQFASIARDVLLLPREATGAAARAIEALAPSSTPVFAYTADPTDLEYYLGREVGRPRTPVEAVRVCRSARPVIFVHQPWVLDPVRVPCTDRPNVRHVRVHQYERGGRIDVWLIPPAPSPP